MKFKIAVAWITVFFLLNSTAHADPCKQDGPSSKVTGVSQCLLTREFGTHEPSTMLIWLHGDISSGGPANYHFSLAKKAAEDFSSRKVRSIALVRPGYADGAGESSSVAFLHSGRRDHYTRENIDEIVGAIKNLKDKFQPRNTVVIGHSGGAAMAASLLGIAPHLVNSAVLVSCPCDLVTWRVGRNAWVRSENPMQWIDKISSTTRIIALMGLADDNTLPILAQTYIESAQKMGINAIYQEIPNENHNSVFRSPMVFAAIESLLSPNE